MTMKRDIKPPTLKDRWLWLLENLRPRACTGHFGLDLFFVCVIYFCQTVLLPTVFRNWILIDLLTPWLAVSAVAMRIAPLTMITVFAALCFEYRLTVPAGFYLCAYWIMVNSIVQIRPTLSWRHSVPWLATFAGCSLWIVIFESIFVNIYQASVNLDYSYWLRQLLRIAISTGFGMLLCQRWLSIDAEEPVPS